MEGEAHWQDENKIDFSPFFWPQIKKSRDMIFKGKKQSNEKERDVDGRYFGCSFGSEWRENGLWGSGSGVASDPQPARAAAFWLLIATPKNTRRNTFSFLTYYANIYMFIYSETKGFQNNIYTQNNALYFNLGYILKCR